MKRFFLALLFLGGGFAQEVRHPLECQTVHTQRWTRRPESEREDEH